MNRHSKCRWKWYGSWGQLFGKMQVAFRQELLSHTHMQIHQVKELTFHKESEEWTNISWSSKTDRVKHKQATVYILNRLIIAEENRLGNRFRCRDDKHSRGSEHRGGWGGVREGSTREVSLELGLQVHREVISGTQEGGKMFSIKEQRSSLASLKNYKENAL